MLYPALRPLSYQLGSWQARARGKKFEINSIHRRGGKDVHHMSMAVQDAIEHGGTHYYLFPTRAWAERAIFKEQFTVGDETKMFWEWIIPKHLKPQKREKDCSIILKNGARLQFGGTDDLSFVGQGGKGYTLSEFSIHKKEVTGFIMPIVRQSNGYLRMNGTLRGRENHLWKLIQDNKDNPDWFVQWLRPQDTKCYCWVDDEFQINPELMDRLGEIGPNYTPIFNVADDVSTGIISHAMAMQEYLNEPVAAFESGYYQHEFTTAKGEGRIFNEEVKYDPNLPVFTFWDLGKGDSYNSTDAMAVWFVQVPDETYSNPGKIHLIDYHESRGRDWAFYAQMLNSKGYWYGNHYAPWDIAKGQAGHEKTNRDYARERGIQFQTVARAPKLSLDIEDVRRFWPKIWAGNNENCVKGMELLQSYHEKTNSDGVGTGKPDHDHSSNCADAARTMVRAFVTKIVEPNLGQKMDWDKFGKGFDGFFD